MNKMIKLPLFLGATAAICGSVLAVTNYFTKDKIAQGEAERVNAAYKAHFPTLRYKSFEEVSESLSSNGVREKIYCFDDSKSYIGTIYTCDAVGFAGKSNPIKFTVSFKDGLLNSYVTISHGESAAGASFINWLDSDSGNITHLDQDPTGSTFSHNAVAKMVSLVSADYTAEYTTIGTYEGE